MCRQDFLLVTFDPLLPAPCPLSFPSSNFSHIFTRRIRQKLSRPIGCIRTGNELCLYPSISQYPYTAKMESFRATKELSVRISCESANSLLFRRSSSARARLSATSVSEVSGSQIFERSVRSVSARKRRSRDLSLTSAFRHVTFTTS